MRNCITYLRYQFPETTLGVVTNNFGTMNISYWTTANLFAGFWIVIRRTPRLNDSRPDSAMRPCGCTECMVMPENQSQINIYPPTVSNILGGHNMTGCMSMGHTLGELDGVFIIFRRSFVWIRCDLFDPTRILTIWNLDTHNDIGSNVVGWGMFCHLNFNFRVSGFRSLQQLGIHRNRHTHMMSVFHLFIELLVRPHGLIIGKTCDNSIGSLVVELEEMRMDVDFRHLEIGKVIIIPFT